MPVYGAVWIQVYAYGRAYLMSPPTPYRDASTCNWGIGGVMTPPYSKGIAISNSSIN